MRTLKRLFFATAIATFLSATASAQTRTGGTTSSSGQLGGTGGSQTGSANQTTGLPFGEGGSVGVQAQQMQTVTNSVTSAQTNVLGGFYANPMYQGRIGTTGATTPGGFGAPLYASSTTGGMTGAGGSRTGTGTTTAGRSGTTTTGFGSQTSSGTTGFGGSTTGASGFGGSTTGATGFGGATTTGGGRSGGTQAGFGGQMGNTTGRGGFGSTGGTTNPNVIAADRAIATFSRSTNLAPANSIPMTIRAQVDLRGIYDRSTSIASGKSIVVSVNELGLVRLRGTVANDDEKRLAIGLAQTTPGVRQVVSELTVQPNP